jgi:hypothetical protein
MLLYLAGLNRLFIASSNPARRDLFLPNEGATSMEAAPFG